MKPSRTLTRPALLLPLLLLLVALLLFDSHSACVFADDNAGTGTDAAPSAEPAAASPSASPAGTSAGADSDAVEGETKEERAARRRRRFMDRFVSIDPEVTVKVFMNFSYDGEPLGGITIGLFGKEVPKTVENFRVLSTTCPWYGCYANSTIHRVEPGFVVQAGDFTRGNGAGGRSIYGRRFEDENFRVPHMIGAVSMANAGPNSNGSQFFICLANNRDLNGKHVVFGHVLTGMEVIHAMEKLPLVNSKPWKDLRITTTGELPVAEDERFPLAGIRKKLAEEEERKKMHPMDAADL